MTTEDLFALILAFFAKGKHDAQAEIDTALYNVETYFDSRIENSVLHVLKVDTATVENGLFNITTQEE